MSPVQFPQANAVIAKDQPEYLPLPSHASPNRKVITSCWELTDDELETVLMTRRIFVSQLTFAQPLQPLVLQTKFDPPDVQ